MINKQYTSNDIFLVTGGTSGIGKAVSLFLLKQGAKVVVIGRSEGKLEKIYKESRYNENLYIVKKDLATNFDALPNFILELSRKYGKFRGCILSAGILDVSPLRILKEKNAKKLFDINYFSTLFMAKAFSDKRVNIGEGSSLVIISSISSIIGESGIVNYSASKGAINSMVKSLAKELSSQKVRVNSILPGTIKTEMVHNCKAYTKEYLEHLETVYPLGLGTINDIIEPIVFLLSDSARWITGTNLVVDGGISL